jgi:hypothetical protein
MSRRGLLPHPGSLFRGASRFVSTLQWALERISAIARPKVSAFTRAKSRAQGRRAARHIISRPFTPAQAHLIVEMAKLNGAHAFFDAVPAPLQRDAPVRFTAAQIQAVMQMLTLDAPVLATLLAQSMAPCEFRRTLRRMAAQPTSGRGRSRPRP